MFTSIALVKTEEQLQTRRWPAPSHLIPPEGVCPATSRESFLLAVGKLIISGELGNEKIVQHEYEEKILASYGLRNTATLLLLIQATKLRDFSSH